MSVFEGCHGPSGRAVMGKVKSEMDGKAPPSFRITRLVELPKSAMHSSLGLHAHRRSDSGILELRMPHVRVGSRTGGGPTLETMLRDVVAFEDENRVLEEPLSKKLKNESRIRTSVRLPGRRAVPIVGPGGVAIHRTANGPQVDVVVRHRGEHIQSSWRSAEAVVDDLFRGFGVTGSEISESQIRVRYGYLELSKYEDQSMMRPVFLAVLDIPPDETGVPYRSISVAAATDTSEMSWERSGP